MLWLCLSISVVVGALLTWLVREFAARSGLVFRPASPRHLHGRPIPRLGGVAVFLTFVTVYALYYLGVRRGLVARPQNFDSFKVLASGSLLFAAGLIDDLRGLKPRTKLFVQIAGGICLYLSGLHFGCFYWSALGPMAGHAVCLLATVFWVVLICNAINLIDGLDGLAASSAIFSMVTILCVALLQGRTGIATSAVILAGALSGFLIFNFNPASIFLGDGGSMFVGFMLSGFVLAESHEQRAVNALAIPLISLALPLTDTTLSVLRRFLSGRSLFGADRDHIHHKLLELGLTQRQVVWVLYGFSAVSVVLSLAFVRPSRFVAIPALTILLLLLFFGLRKLRYSEFLEFERVWSRVLQQKRACARNIAMRKAAAELQNSHKLSSVISILENCLQPEFEGFEIRLNDRFLRSEVGRRFWSSRLEGFWGYSSEETSVFSLELNTPKYGNIGQICLYRSDSSEWVTDVDLLTGEFRKSLGFALQNCLTHEVSVVTLPVINLPGMNAQVQPHRSMDVLEDAESHPV